MSASYLIAVASMYQHELASLHSYLLMLVKNTLTAAPLHLLSAMDTSKKRKYFRIFLHYNTFFSIGVLGDNNNTTNDICKAL